MAEEWHTRFRRLNAKFFPLLRTFYKNELIYGFFLIFTLKWAFWVRSTPEAGRIYLVAENLNYGKMVPSGTTKFDDKVTEKLCYVDDEWFCDNHFGGLYSWAEAMNLPKVCDSVDVSSNDACKVFADSARSEEKARTIIWQGICPDGWHIMNKREWIYTNGDLRSSILWEKNAGRNTDGLAVIPTGNGYAGIHEYAYMWLPMADSITYTVTSSFTLNSKKTSIIRWVRDSFQSIRCVMDANNTLIH